MLQFDIITIFPEIFDSYFKESILKRAQEKKIIKIKIHNLRDYTKDKHKTVDDRPYGGGAGMIMKVDVIYRAVLNIIDKRIEKRDRRIILFSAKGKKFEQKKAQKLKKYKQIILICGRYEGVDERVAKYIADEELSIGDYVLTGGELPAMVVLDATARLMPGVIKEDSLKEESFNSKIKNSKLEIQKEYPQYTRPEIFEPKKFVKNWKAYPSNFCKTKTWRVPRVLLSGHHKNIKDWQNKHSKKLEK
jgi:tRNA (guanine37-N1)-methyltransferase